MSELKIYRELEDYVGYDNVPLEMYDKDEADKVIAQLKKACNDKDDWCLHTLKENRNQKYKRCLAMVRWCDEAYKRECSLNPEELTDKEFYRQLTEFWPRWSSKWITIAEKFKEAK